MSFRRTAYKTGFRSLAVSLLLLAHAGAHAQDMDPRMGFRPPIPGDFSGENWTASFAQAHRKLSAEYAFSDWKSVDWEELYRIYEPAVSAADKGQDREAFYLALRDYLFAVDDGHLSIPRVASNASLADGLTKKQSGGSYGLGLARLDDGRVILAALRDGGAAQTAGLRVGSEVLSWNGQAIDQAMENVKLGRLAASSRVATNVHRQLEQLRLLTRAPVGTVVKVTFRESGEGPIQTVEVVALDDDLRDMNLFNLAPNPSEVDEVQVLSSRMLQPQIGYIRLVAEADLKDLGTYPHAILERFVMALNQLRSKGAEALVLDLRGNHGGFDTLSADLCGVFAEKRSVFEKTVFYDQRDGGFLEFTYDDRVDDVVDSIDIVPRQDAFRGPVAVLINPRTISSGEGLAKCIAALPQGTSIGFHGTNGSFGIATGEILMPAGLVIHYPNGRSVDATGEIQIDSRKGVGGVQPEHRVPSSTENILRYARGEDVELQSAIHILQHQQRK